MDYKYSETNDFFDDKRLIHSPYLHGATIEDCDHRRKRPDPLTSKLVFDSLKDYYGENIIRLDQHEGFDRIIIGSSDTSVTVIRGSLIIEKNGKLYSLDNIYDDMELIKEVVKRIYKIDELELNLEELHGLVDSNIIKIDDLQLFVRLLDIQHKEKINLLRSDLLDLTDSFNLLENRVDVLELLPNEINGIKLDIASLELDFNTRVLTTAAEVLALKNQVSDIVDRLNNLKLFEIITEAQAITLTPEKDKLYFIVDE